MIKLQKMFMIDGIDRPLSSLALGTAFFNLAEKDRWFSIVDDFVAYGGTLLDTARDYGESEDVIGQWIESRGVREQIVLSTKGGQGKGYGLSEKEFSKTIKEELARSLDHLGTCYVDIYLLHRDSPLVSVEEIMDCLNTELSAGHIRAIGASNWEYDRFEAANAYAEKHGLRGFSMVSNNLSLAAPTGPFYPGLVSVTPDAEKWHERTQTPLIAWSSQARGFFTGRYSPEMLGCRDTIQDPFTRRMIEIYGTSLNFEKLRRATRLGERKGISATQVALAWLLHKPFPVVAIVGPRTIEELSSCVAATHINLSEQEMRWLSLEEGDQSSTSATPSCEVR